MRSSSSAKLLALALPLVACGKLIGAGDLLYEPPDAGTMCSSGCHGGASGGAGASGSAAGMAGAGGSGGATGSAGGTDGGGGHAGDGASAGMGGSADKGGSGGAGGVGGGGSGGMGGARPTIGSPGSALCTGDCACDASCPPEIGCIGGVCGGALRVGIAAYTACATRNEVSYCWGDRSWGQMATPAMDPTGTPQALVGIDHSRYAVSTGFTTCVLGMSGGVHCVGSNEHGGLGIGNAVGSPDCRDGLCVTTFQEPILDMPVIELQAAGYWIGGRHFCARYADRTLRCWGDDAGGETGAGEVRQFDSAPVKTKLEDVVQVLAGVGFTCARTSVGDVYCWGENASGQLGQGDTSPRSTPAKVMENVVLLGGGIWHVCAVDTKGALLCWGSNDGAQLGVGLSPAMVESPIEVPDAPPRITQIAGGFLHTCALTSDAEVWCWGAADYGQIGDGSLTGPLVTDGGHPATGPRRASISDVVEIASSGSTIFARKRDGTLWSWGSDEQGLLGQSTIGGSAPSPAQIMLP